MFRPSRWTVPLSGCRCPVIRLNSVDLPAPLGPITAAIWRVSTVTLTSQTARKPAKDLERPAISSTAKALQPVPRARDTADDPDGGGEQQDQEDRAEHKRPVMRVGGDGLVQPDQHRGAHRRPPEIAHAAEDGHDHDLGR